MAAGIRTIISLVKDLARAKALYGKLLGAEPYMNEAYYVGFNVAGQGVVLDTHGHAQGMTGPLGYRHVEDTAQTIQRLQEAGATVRQLTEDVGNGKLIASVQDLDGNIAGLIQA